MGCVCSKVKGGDSKKDSNVAYSPVKQRDPNKKEKNKQEGKKYQKLGTADEHEDEQCAEEQALEDLNVTKEGGYSLLVTEHDEDLSLNVSDDVKDSEEQESKNQAQADTSEKSGIELTDDAKENANVTVDLQEPKPAISAAGAEDKKTDLSKTPIDMTDGDSTKVSNNVSTTKENELDREDNIDNTSSADASVESKGDIFVDDTVKASETIISLAVDLKHSDVNNTELKNNETEIKEANDFVDGNLPQELFISEDTEAETSQGSVRVIAAGDKGNSGVDNDADKKRKEDENTIKKISTKSTDNAPNTESANSKDDVILGDPKSQTTNECNDDLIVSDQNIGSDDVSTDTIDVNCNNKTDNCTNANDVDALDEENADVDCAENEPLLVVNEDKADTEPKVNGEEVNEQETLESSVTNTHNADTKGDTSKTEQNIDETDSRIAHQFNDSNPNNVNDNGEVNGESNDVCEEKEPLLIITVQTDIEERTESNVDSPDGKIDVSIVEQSVQEQYDKDKEMLSPDDVEMQLPTENVPVSNHVPVNGAISESENVPNIQNEDFSKNNDNDNNVGSLQLQYNSQGESQTQETNLTSPNGVNFGDDHLHMQFSPTSVMNDSQFEETELTFEKAKYVIHAAIHYLKTCKHYTSPKACAVMKKLSVASCVISTIKSETRTHLANYLVQTGFAELFVKIARTLHADAEDTVQTEDSLKVMKGTCTNFSTGNEFESLVCELARHGAIGLLLQELDEYFPTNSDHKLLHVVHTLNILSNCVRCSDGHIRESYRNANAVNILMKYLKSNEIKLKLESLSILAYIVDDKECDLLADVQGLFLCLLDTLNEAVTADDFYVHYNIAGEPCGDGVYGLIDTLNRLVMNDSCKRQVVDQGGLPIITQILQIQGADAQDSQLAALEALWKIAFIEKHQQILIQHILDSNVVPILTVMQASQSASLRDASTGLLWKLGLVDIHAADDGDDEEELEQIMLSYVKDNFRQAKKLRDILSAAGFKVWMDLQKGDGNFITSMVDALHNSAVVLVCVSLKYRESVHCQTEATYAHESTKPIIPLLIEEEYKGDGWLAELMSSTKQFNAYSDEALEEDIEELIDELVDCGCI